ncbi:MAG TPA: 3-hydroxyacyl-CoA dehydrogenase NAD-binding domain-containing protein [Kineosporiaceae bacterium]|nr:3-hydroxyacyl-CoA dehydrogenase NAD-binding domain-containing protein [Kineosporiaceae bacterium]
MTAVAVIGAGTMGAGIAEVSARAGHRVRLHDTRPDAAATALGELGHRLDRDVARGRLDPPAADAVLARVRVVEHLDDLAGCGVVVEAVAEDLEVKRTLLRAVEDVTGQGVGREVVLATNTSSLSITAIATALRRPGLLVGLHFFNPAPRMSLVEVVRGDATDPKVVDAAAELVRDWGKTPVLCASTPGFVVNRVARPFYGEAQRLVEAGVASAATIDAVLREAGGFPMGPFRLTDLVGQDVNLAVSSSVWEQTYHDPRYAPTTFQRRLVDAGRLGRKSGRGVFTYTPDGHALDADPDDAAPRPAPESVELVEYDFGPMTPFLDRIAAGGVRVEHVEADDAEVLEELPGLRLPGGGLLRVTDGSTARSWSLEAPDGVVLLDWAHNPATCSRVALMAPRGIDPAVLDAAIGLCQAAGVAVSVVGDVAGGIVARTVAMLVDEAVDLVARGEATATDVDVAMLLGAARVGRPRGCPPRRLGAGGAARGDPDRPLPDEPAVGRGDRRRGEPA